MKTLLSVISVIVVAVTTEALVCQKCDNYLGQTCKDPTDEICPSNCDQCFTKVMREIMFGISFYQSKRGCAVDKNACNEHINMTVGEHMEIQRPSHCCTGDYCNKKPVKFETPKVTKKNGLKCPSCFVKGNNCEEKTIECYGLQDRCYHFDGGIFNGMKFEQWIIKGCSNKEGCEYKPNPDYDLPFYERGYKTECSKPYKPVTPHMSIHT